MDKPVATYLSFGAGLQSSALAAMSALGLRGAPKADFAVFADTQAEPPWVYEHLVIMTEWLKKYDIPVIIASAGNLAEDQLSRSTTDSNDQRFASAPFWTTGGDGKAVPGRRQCTREYKIDVIEQAVRKHLGYIPRQRVKHAVTALIGISWDERQRTRISQTPWVTNKYPLVEGMISVAGCQSVLREVGLPIPQKSACWFCPYHNDRFWVDLKTDHPELFAKVCEFDDAIRDQGVRGMKNLNYVHRSLTPLKMVEFKPSADERAKPEVGLFDGFREDCSGMCGV